jgi:hypothetical protein
MTKNKQGVKTMEKSSKVFHLHKDMTLGIHPQAD